jgi:hypothetical protein
MVKHLPDTLATEMKYSRSINFAFPLGEKVEGRLGFHHFTTRRKTGR